ncbi:hypothetical protein F5Y18DRAFT_421615 [Xylariaceae sp. FL1019]|nr:hypothetical protein F5Y18DRAFT_421615 [Xylariaceae sp. FL1019]
MSTYRLFQTKGTTEASDASGNMWEEMAQRGSRRKRALYLEADHDHVSHGGHGYSHWEAEAAEQGPLHGHDRPKLLATVQELDTCLCEQSRRGEYGQPNPEPPCARTSGTSAERVVLVEYSVEPNGVILLLVVLNTNVRTWHRMGRYRDSHSTSALVLVVIVSLEDQAYYVGFNITSLTMVSAPKVYSPKKEPQAENSIRAVAKMPTAERLAQKMPVIVIM